MATSVLDFAAYVQECVVKISGPEKKSGTGFWVLEWFCVTCLHNLLNRKGKPSPSVSLEHKGKRFQALYRADLSDAEEDIAVLEVGGAEAQAQGVPLGKTSLGSTLEAFGYRWGFPKGYGMSGEKWRPAGYVPGQGHLYSFQTGLGNGSSVEGMSGCPIFDARRMVVFGIQHAEEKVRGGLCYAHPIEYLYKNWPTLEEENRKISKLFNRPRLQRSIEESPSLERSLELVEETNVPESLEVKKEFHRITALRWKYIQAKADSARDLYQEILREAENGKAGFRFFCILGEPLSGKSTLMRRLGYEITCKGGLVLYVLDAKKADLWNHIVELSDLANETIYVLVDDILDDREAFSRLEIFAREASEQDLGIRVIGTSLRSRMARERLDHLRGEGAPTLVRQLELTARDKDEILRNLKIDPMSIDVRAFTQLMSITRLYPFLAQIREFLEGASFGAAESVPAEMLEEKRLQRLLEQQSRLYAAYRYVTFVHRYNLTLPLSLLQYVENSRFADVLSLEGYGDWIFEPESQDPNNPTIQAAHWAVAQIHWDIYRQSESPAGVLRELIQAGRADDARHGVFMTHLFRVCLPDPATKIIMRDLLTESELSRKIRGLQTTVGVDHLRIWQRIYRELQLQVESDRCLQEAKTREPVNVADMLVQVDLLEGEDPKRALSVLQEWKSKQPQNNAIRSRYLTLIASAFPGQLRSVLSQVDEWMADAGENTSVVAEHTNVVIQHAPNLVREVATRIHSWLTNEENRRHKGASPLWMSYLRLIDASAESKLIGNALDDCWKWLLEHRNERGFIQLVHFYVSLLKERGVMKQKREVLRELLFWLDSHPRVGHVWVACLNFVDAPWSVETDVRGVIDKLATHFEDIHHPNTVVRFLDHLQRSGTREERKRGLDKAYDWLENPLHWDDNYARARYQKFLRNCGCDEQADRTLAQNRRWFREHDDDVTVRVAHLKLVEGKRPELMEAEIEDAVRWLSDHPEHPKADHVREKLASMKRNK